MNNLDWTATGAFVAGVVLSAVVTFRITQKYYEGVIDEEIASVKKFYAAREEFQKPTMFYGSTVIETIDEILEDNGYHQDSFPDIPWEDETPLEELRVVIDVGDPEEDENDDDPIMVEGQPMNNVRAGYLFDPKVISKRAYEQGYPDHERVTLKYFKEDDTLTDSNEEIIPDAVTLIGARGLEDLREDTLDDEDVYVRNTRISTDFEIITERGSFRELVLGIVPEE